MSELTVGMGEVGVSLMGETLTALGLGSCIGVIIYDPEHHVAGMAHVMLPDSANARLPVLDRSVLLAEADPAVRDAIRRILLASGFRVAAETSEREETLRRYRQSRPSVLLMSAFLPPGSWVETYDGLRQIDKNANVVVLSPPVASNVIMDYLHRGVREVILNPFTEQKVVTSVEYVLQRSLLKFADRAVPLLKAKLVALGAKPQHLVAKIVGGAHMFPSIQDEEVIRIGKRNAESVKLLLEREGIRLLAEEIGGNLGRTARFDPFSGELRVSSKDGERVL